LGGGGGGGSAHRSFSQGGAGGRGVVIISYATLDATGFTVTGGNKTTSGLNTIHTFLTSGNLVVT
jgi:hypothetical protein